MTRIDTTMNGMSDDQAEWISKKTNIDWNFANFPNLFPLAKNRTNSVKKITDVKICEWFTYHLAFSKLLTEEISIQLSCRAL